MKEITIPILWAAAEAWLGPLLWLAIAAVILVLALYFVAARRHGSLGRAIAAGWLRAALAGAAAGIVFAAALPWLTHSRWSYVSGAVDYIAIFLAGVGAAVAIIYALTPLIALAKRREAGQ